MKVLIVEDEKSASKRLINLLNELDPAIEVLQVLDTVKRTADWFRHNRVPDLLFLDIHLADGLSFDVFEDVDIACPVIFTTAYDQYALKAFELHSIDYLLKPIDSQKLEKALGKYRMMVKPAGSMLDASVLQQALDMMQGKRYKERFIVKYGEHIRSIAVDDICCFFSEEKITFFKIYQGRKFVVDYTLEQVEQLVDPGNFFRINRKYIIHVDAIEDVVVYSNSRLKLVVKHLTDVDTIVAREKVQAFKSWLDR